MPSSAIRCTAFRLKHPSLHDVYTSEAQSCLQQSKLQWKVAKRLQKLCSDQCLGCLYVLQSSATFKRKSVCSVQLRMQSVQTQQSEHDRLSRGFLKGRWILWTLICDMYTGVEFCENVYQVYRCASNAWYNWYNCRICLWAQTYAFNHASHCVRLDKKP